VNFSILYHILFEISISTAKSSLLNHLKNIFPALQGKGHRTHYRIKTSGNWTSHHGFFSEKWNLKYKLMIKVTMSIVFSVLISSVTLIAQQQIEIPQEVKIQFLDDFISATNTTWDTDSTGNYKAEFAHQSQTKTVFYKKDGTWLYTETQLFSGQVPSFVLQTLSSTFKAYDLHQITKRDAKESASFRLEIRVKNAVYEIKMDSAGKIKSKRKLYNVADQDDYL
jgi:hypothetical protein